MGTGEPSLLLAAGGRASPRGLLSAAIPVSCFALGRGPGLKEHLLLFILPPYLNGPHPHHCSLEYPSSDRALRYLSLPLQRPRREEGRRRQAGDLVSQVTQHCPRRDWTLKSTGKGKSQRLSFRQVARGDPSSRRNVITFTFQVTPRLITATGNSCWEEEVFSH